MRPSRDTVIARRSRCCRGGAGCSLGETRIYIQQAGKRYGTNGPAERAISILAHSHDTRAGQI